MSRFSSEHLQRRADALDEKAETAVTDLAAQGLRKSARKLRDKAKQQADDTEAQFTRFRRLKLEAWLAAGGSAADFDTEYPETNLMREFVERRANAIENRRARDAKRWARAFLS